MIKEILQEKESVIKESIREIEDKLRDKKKELLNLYDEYVSEYGCIPYGTKIRVTLLTNRFNEEITETFDAFVADNKYCDNGYDYDYVSLYEDKKIKTKLFKIKKDGTQSCNILRLYGKVINIETLSESKEKELSL